ncbi:hypothetical protein KUTeg_003780 [Tegillarca granosa]|uniref:Uncharacterized protein n=1 Tax=Tegillarca granosa TaxID=220873 RepID=A0ABQ9FN23_TEGGR|nr:hypothetical protein KUTeg_003780 [Tegillarca granosa]
MGIIVRQKYFGLSFAPQKLLYSSRHLVSDLFLLVSLERKTELFLFSVHDLGCYFNIFINFLLPRFPDAHDMIDFNILLYFIISNIKILFQSIIFMKQKINSLLLILICKKDIIMPAKLITIYTIII